MTATLFIVTRPAETAALIEAFRPTRASRRSIISAFRMAGRGGGVQRFIRHSEDAAMSRRSEKDGKR